MVLNEDFLHAKAIAEEIRKHGGRALVVGGYARDCAMRDFGLEISDSRDIDLEVYYLKPDALASALSKFGEIKLVGESFGVWKVGNIDVSLPRSDSKIGERHQDFLVNSDPFMSFKEAARRRDLTINSIAFDPLTGEVIDHWGGVEDIRKKILRATDPELFGDDALRVLRLAQFAGRFNFRIDLETLFLARGINLSHLPRERIGEEWKKLLLRSGHPSIGFQMMRALLVIAKLHLELKRLEGTPQDPEWHPEGDVWRHTCLVVDAAAKIVRAKNWDEEASFGILLAALCHDLGKPETTKFFDGRWRSHEHSEKGEAPTRSFLHALAVGNSMIEKVVALVKEHLWPSLNFDKKTGRILASNGSIRRLALRLHPATIEELVAVAEADHKGRVNVDTSFPQGQELLSRAERLLVADTQPKPILLGRHLIEMGLTPGPDFGTILRKVFFAQVEEEVTTLDEAKALGAKTAQGMGLMKYDS